MSHQYLIDNYEGAAAIANNIYEMYGTPEMFKMIPEIYYEEVIDEDGNFIKTKKTRIIKKPIIDILGLMLL